MKLYITRIFLLILVPLLMPGLSRAQRIDQLSSLRSFNEEKSFRFVYENDFFSAQDIYYTQGINLELIHPSLQKNPISKILLTDNSGDKFYGLSIQHNGFTPTSIRRNEILRSDRPFAAALMLRSFSYSRNRSKETRISSALSLGVLGPEAGGREMQTEIHRALDNLLPLGWESQIQTDVIVNYQIQFEKDLLMSAEFLQLFISAKADAGTFLNKINSGLNLRLGNFYKKENQKNIRVHLYARSEINAVAYDATLSGGIFNRKSPHKLNSNEISRLVFQHTGGIMIRLKNVNLEYFQCVLSKEIKKGIQHRYGGISIGIFW